MSEHAVIVKVDERIRLATAVLAAGDWPQLEQAREAHAVHNQSKLTRQFVRPFREHPAVVHVNAALHDNRPLAQIFAEALQDRAGVYASFRNDTQIETAFWSQHPAVWREAVQDLRAIFAGVPLPPFLERLIERPLGKQIVIVPTLVFPMLSTTICETADCFYVVLPPPKAWGESPPWPYRDGAAWVLAETCREMVGRLLAQSLSAADAEKAALLKHGAATLFLETALDETESIAYLVRAKRQFNLPRLPAFVAALRHCLDAPRRDSIYNLAGIPRR